MQLGTLIGSDEFWVQVSIPVDKLRWLNVPGMNAREGEGSEAKVTQQLGGETVTRPGRILRLLGDLDPVGRMARVLVSIDDPLLIEARARRGATVAGVAVEDVQDTGAKRTEQSDLPLLLDSYVDVSLESESLQSVIEIPRRALQGGDRVFVYGTDGRLQIREVDVLWRRPETVLVTRGLEDGESIVVSRVPGAVEGLPLRQARVAVGQRTGDGFAATDGGAAP